MGVKITNNATSTLAGSISDSDTTIAIQSGDAAKFPTLGGSDWTRATIVDAAGNIEIVRVTARSGVTLTVVRGQEGTTAIAWDAGDRIDCRLTAGVIDDFTEPGARVHDATAQTTMADGDEIGLWQAAATAWRKITWANFYEAIRTKLGPMVSANSAKSTPVDADQLLLSDSAASNGSSKLSWLNLKAGVFAAWGALINGGTAKATPVAADAIALMDSAASNATKKLLLSALRSWLFSTMTTVNGGPLGGFRDLVINGDGGFNQRTYTTVADDTYWCDRHYVLVQTAAVTPTIISDVADGLPNMMRLTQSQASAQRMGNAQIVESKPSKRMRGKQVTLGGKLRCSSSQAIRFAILEWTGTADTVTSDVVNSWTNGTFTAGQFFNSTTLTVAAVGTITPAANTVTDWSLLATISSSCNNLILVYWTEGTAAQNVTLDMAWGLVQGDASGELWPYAPRHPHQELALCQRYYHAGYVDHIYGAPGSTYQSSFTVTLPVTMRATPTVSVGTPIVNSGVAVYLLTVMNTRELRSLLQANASTNAQYSAPYSTDSEL